MTQPSRRDFFRHSAAAAGGSLLAKPSQAGESAAPSSGSQPPARSFVVPGLHAYTVPMSVAAGEPLHVHVSSTVPYDLSICRLGTSANDPSGDEVLIRLNGNPPCPQPISPGSYVLIEQRLDDSEPISALTFEGWIRPWAVDRWAGFVAQHDPSTTGGVGLLLAPEGRIALCLGDGTPWRDDRLVLTPSGTIARRRWHHVAGTFSGTTAAIWIDGRKHVETPIDGPVIAGPAPLVLGAYVDHGSVEHHLDGDLAAVAIHARALGDAEITERFAARGLRPAQGPGVLGSWPFHEERGERIEDVSEHARHGTIINHGTWMIGGRSFDANVPRFGNYDPANDPRRGHGLRLAADDLYDCRWRAVHDVTLPAAAKPGIYVARFDYIIDEQPYQYHATFIVKKSRAKRPAPILVLAATNTWKAYSGGAFARGLPPGMHVCGTGGFANSEGDPPAYCFYRGHAAGQGCYQLGMRMPWPTAGPYVLYGDAKTTAYSHLARADRFLHIWLERAGYEFDVVSDLDVHCEPDLFRQYKAVVINGHSEYWSLEMLNGLRRYLDDDRGNVLCMSGNSLFWRVSFNEDRSIIECRKVDAPGNQMTPEERGESWHSQDGRRGGLLTENGFPGWTLVGLATLGWNNPSDPAHFGPFYVENPDHFLFRGPIPLAIKQGDPLGQAAGGAIPKAGGHEVDVRPSTLRTLLQSEIPAGAVHPDDPPGIELLAAGRDWPKTGATFDYYFRQVQLNRPVGGELIYWKRPSGGQVVNAGAIGAGWSLVEDRTFQSFVQNVLHHFGVPIPG